jgi:hypothetical protein
MDFISYAREHHGNINAHMIRRYCYAHNHQTFSNGQKAFRYATIRGQTKIAKLILEMNQNINISAGNEHAFRHACKGGHLKMAKWLLRIKPDIDTMSLNNWAIHAVIERGYNTLFSWLRKKIPINLTESNWIEIHNLPPYLRYERQQLLLQPWRLPPRIFQRTIFNDHIPLDIGIIEEIINEAPVLSDADIIPKPRPKFNICNTIEKNELTNACELCAICYEKESNVITTCYHMYCEKCILKWTRKHDTCPMCRTQLEHDTGLTKIV